VSDELKPNPNILPLPADGPGSMAGWVGAISSAQANLQKIAATRQWDNNLKAYLGEGDRRKYGENTTLIRKDFALTEIKKALLCYQTPEVSAEAKNPQFEAAAPLVGAVMNDYLGQNRLNAMAMIDEVLMDLLCPAGIGVTKLGYEAFVDPKVKEIPAPNPVNPQMPAIDQMTGKPVMQPNIVRESCFWQRIPPKMFLYPPTFIGSDFDKAGWLGFKYTLNKTVAQRVLELNDDETPAGSSLDFTKDLLASDVGRDAAQDTNTVSVFEIWYRAAEFDPEVGDPEIFRQLVILEGRESAPIIHRDSPYQEIQDGKMIAGMRGNPIHVFTLRYVSDQAIPQSDSSASRDQVDELSRGRTQMIDQRDRNMPLIAYDPSRVPKESVDKYLKGVTQELIAIPGMDGSNSPFVPIQKGAMHGENFEFNNIINRDIGEAWSLGQNQLGLDTDSKRTATELSLMQSGTDTRMDKERSTFLRKFAAGCQKALALIQMFATEEDWARVADEQGQMVLQQWDNTSVAGDYTITLAPDSSQRIDGAAMKKEAVDIYKMFGNDPMVNQIELRKATFRKLGMDPNRLVLQPQPKQPEKPQVSLALKGEDMSPIMPQYVNVATILATLGIGMAPPPVPGQPPQGVPPQPPQTNPGTVAEVTPIDKRADDGSGKLPGAGAAADVAQVGGR
jgi:hypothetical protein